MFAANDEAAWGVLSELGRSGWGVPKNIAVCGFGDIPLAKIVMPSLTTVHIGLHDLVHAGARKLLAILHHDDVTFLEVQPTLIIERGTSAQIADQSA